MPETSAQETWQQQVQAILSADKKDDKFPNGRIYAAAEVLAQEKRKSKDKKFDEAREFFWPMFRSLFDTGKYNYLKLEKDERKVNDLGSVNAAIASMNKGIAKDKIQFARNIVAYILKCEVDSLNQMPYQKTIKAIDGDNSIELIEASSQKSSKVNRQVGTIASPRGQVSLLTPNQSKETLLYSPRAQQPKSASSTQYQKTLTREEMNEAKKKLTKEKEAKEAAQRKLAEELNNKLAEKARAQRWAEEEAQLASSVQANTLPQEAQSNSAPAADETVDNHSTAASFQPASSIEPEVAHNSTDASLPSIQAVPAQLDADSSSTIESPRTPPSQLNFWQRHWKPVLITSIPTYILLVAAAPVLLYLAASMAGTASVAFLATLVATGLTLTVATTLAAVTWRKVDVARKEYCQTWPDDNNYEGEQAPLLTQQASSFPLYNNECASGSAQQGNIANDAPLKPSAPATEWKKTQ